MQNKSVIVDEQIYIHFDTNSICCANMLLCLFFFASALALSCLMVAHLLCPDWGCDVVENAALAHRIAAQLETFEPWNRVVLICRR